MSTADLTAGQVLSIVHSLFPGAQLTSWAPIPGAHENLLYTLTLSDLSEIVLKIYAAALDAAAPRREAHLLRTITAETGVPVPRILSHDERLPWEGNGGEGAHAWALLSRLPGISLLQTMDALEQAELEAVAYELGRYLAHLHQIPLEAFGCLLDSGPHDHVREKGYVLSQANDWLERCEVEGLLAPETAAALRLCFEQTLVLDRHQPCLTHADLGAQKVMVERGLTGHHVTGLVGWTRAQGGSPELDIAKLFAWDFRQASSAQKGLLDGYTESAELPPHLWERLGLYEAFVSLEALLVSHRTHNTRLLQQAAEQIHRYLEAPGGGERGNHGSATYV
jgi:aminoglycoside phosphotransferase (APT) family kinase protein